MFELVKIRDTVRVPPERFDEPKQEVILDILRENYEGLTDNDLGVILSITEVEDIGTGRVVMGEAASFHNVVFSALTYRPILHEITPGEVVEIVDFGAFVRLGAMDGLAHVSQITDDYINFDSKKSALVGKETNRKLKEGDKVRARVVSISMAKGERGKIGLTMRQPGLGKFEWIEEERKEGEAEESG
ncbi:DNA-directed RNA polymerase subunit E' [candidate division MSBL1 archaeon SCGC-AAA259E19]|uniref:DNA-directed RNA polymerase subunit Rpo7 n=2 Tax=candidate division MSBL1 TaxID=215777 RepID=A0A133V472_9EURY|nr:DNA-directed RNA polymerase subunit E' [candidate division MSBL1 archaeon SCGC-AAA259E19]KXB01240.1 DNA-directed RNA polymerase subunit E' [candidate division MSBL1 archaeon SCGC-AAA259O05]